MMPRDTGTPVEPLRRDSPGLEFSSVSKSYPKIVGRCQFSKDAMTQRGGECRCSLKARYEKTTVVV